MDKYKRNVALSQRVISKTMAQEFSLGKWIRGNKALKTKARFADKIGAHPTMVSRWMGGGGISDDYQLAIRKLGYEGPWPAEEAQDAAAGGPVPYVTREEFDRWTGRVDGLLEERKKEIGNLRRRLQEAFSLIQDLGIRAGIELPKQEPVE